MDGRVTSGRRRTRRRQITHLCRAGEGTRSDLLAISPIERGNPCQGLGLRPYAYAITAIIGFHFYAIYTSDGHTVEFRCQSPADGGFRPEIPLPGAVAILSPSC